MGLLDGGAQGKQGLGVAGLFSDPNQMAMLGLAQGLLQAGAPSRVPVNMGQAMAQGLQGMTSGYGSGLEMQQQQIARQMALGKLGFFNQLFGSGPQGTGSAAGVDQQSKIPEESNPMNPTAFQTTPGAAPVAQSMRLNSGYLPQPSAAAGLPKMPDAKTDMLANLSPSQLAGAVGMGFLPKEAFDIWKYTKDGIERKPGTWYKDTVTGKMTFTPDPTKGLTSDENGNVGVMNGFIPSNAAIKGSEAGAVAGAQEGAKSQYDLVPVYQNGQMMLVPKSQLLGSAAKGSYSPATAPLGQGAYQEGVSKAAADTYAGMQTSAMQAQGDMQKLQRIGQLLEGVAGGKYAPNGYELQSAFKTMGINIGSGSIANKDAATALATSMLPGMLKNSGVNRLTQQELSLFSSTLPTLANTPEGRKLMIANSTSLLKRQIEIAKMARAWQGSYGRIDATSEDGSSFQDRLDLWTERHPIFQKAQQGAK